MPNCSDCGIPSHWEDGNHTTDAECVEALKVENVKLRAEMEYAHARWTQSDLKATHLELQNEVLQKIVDDAVALVKWHGAGAIKSERYDHLFSSAGNYHVDKTLKLSELPKNDRCRVALPYGQSGVPDFCEMIKPCPRHPDQGENYNDLGVETDRD